MILWHLDTHKSLTTNKESQMLKRFLHVVPLLIALTGTCQQGGMVGNGSSQTLISKQTLASTASSVTFSTIPQTYTHLHLVILTAGSATGNININFNGDVGSTYSYSIVGGNGTSAFASKATAQTAGEIGAVSTTPGTYCLDIAGYSSTTLTKSSTSTLVTNGPPYSEVVGTNWNNTAAITSIVFTPSTGTLAAGSIFSLYGLQ